MNTSEGQHMLDVDEYDVDEYISRMMMRLELLEEDLRGDLCSERGHEVSWCER